MVNRLRQIIADFVGKKLTNLTVRSSRSSKSWYWKHQHLCQTSWFSMCMFHEERGLSKKIASSGPTTVEITRLKLHSESTAIKNLIIVYVVCWPGNRHTDWRCVIKRDRNRISEICFIKSKAWFDKSIRK